MAANVDNATRDRCESPGSVRTEVEFELMIGFREPGGVVRLHFYTHLEIAEK